MIGVHSWFPVFTFAVFFDAYELVHRILYSNSVCNGARPVSSLLRPPTLKKGGRSVGYVEREKEQSCLCSDLGFKHFLSWCVLPRTLYNPVVLLLLQVLVLSGTQPGHT